VRAIACRRAKPQACRRYRHPRPVECAPRPRRRTASRRLPRRDFSRRPHAAPHNAAPIPPYVLHHPFPLFLAPFLPLSPRTLKNGVLRIILLLPLDKIGKIGYISSSRISLGFGTPGRHEARFSAASCLTGTHSLAANGRSSWDYPYGAARAGRPALPTLARNAALLRLRAAPRRTCKRLHYAVQHYRLGTSKFHVFPARQPNSCTLSRREGTYARTPCMC
jgi:hypothetical protein